MIYIMTNKCYLVLLELGLAAFDENKNLIVSKKFDNAIISYRLIKSGGKPEELNDIIEKLRPFDDILVNDAGIAFLLRQAGLNGHTMPQTQQEEIQNTKSTLIVKSGFSNSEMDAMRLLRDFAIELSSSRIKEASEKLDFHIIQSINTLDELDKIINTIATRMREWYSLHFPELDNLIQSITTYAEIVREAGLRQNITREILKDMGIQDGKIEIIMDVARRSKGGHISQENLTIVKKLSDEVITLSELRRILADHIEVSMETVAPNIKELLTASVGARIIAKVGSLSKLASLPASTIQVLGAEKALFRALKTGARPPKHGLLFQHPVIHSAPKWQRGKIARAVASKVAIAARIDVYRHADKDLSILDRLNTRIAEIQIKNKDPISEKERNRKYREHEQRQQRQQLAPLKKDKRIKNRKKYGKRFGKRQY